MVVAHVHAAHPRPPRPAAEAATLDGVAVGEHRGRGRWRRSRTRTCRARAARPRACCPSRTRTTRLRRRPPIALRDVTARVDLGRDHAADVSGGAVERRRPRSRARRPRGRARAAASTASVRIGATLARLVQRCGLSASVSRRTLPCVNIGILGCGNVSDRYFDGLAQHEFLRSSPAPTSTVIARRRRRRSTAYRARARQTSSWQIAEVELLVNLTPPQVARRREHGRHSSGKHVWSEKPLAASLADGRRAP